MFLALVFSHLEMHFVCLHLCAFGCWARVIIPSLYLHHPLATFFTLRISLRPISPFFTHFFHAYVNGISSGCVVLLHLLFHVPSIPLPRTCSCLPCLLTFNLFTLLPFSTHPFPCHVATPLRVPSSLILLSTHVRFFIVEVWSRTVLPDPACGTAVVSPPCFALIFVSTPSLLHVRPCETRILGFRVASLLSRTARAPTRYVRYRGLFSPHPYSPFPVFLLPLVPTCNTPCSVTYITRSSTRSSDPTHCDTHHFVSPRSFTYSFRMSHAAFTKPHALHEMPLRYLNSLVRSRPPRAMLPHVYSASCIDSIIPSASMFAAACSHLEMQKKFLSPSAERGCTL
jgi:hypothetical protein